MLDFEKTTSDIPWPLLSTITISSGYLNSYTSPFSCMVYPVISVLKKFDYLTVFFLFGSLIPTFVTIEALVARFTPRVI